MDYSTILQHVPKWVFVLLAALVALGVSQSFTRRVTLRRSAVMPVVLLALSLAGVVSSFGAVIWALPAWAAGVATALVSLRGRVDTSAVRFEPAMRQFTVPGSWWPLGLMMALFALKFVAGAALARQPALAASLPFAATASAAYGLFSGAFLGRAMALWALARQPGSPALRVA